MIEIFSPAEVERARASGAFIASVLREMRARTEVGTNLLQIDRWVGEMIAQAGAESCYVDYAPSFGNGPFGHWICTSVNDAVLHGLPFDYNLEEGDLLSLDFAASVEGIVADAAISFVVGTPRSGSDLRMIEATQLALAAGIAAVVPGGRVGDISSAVGVVLGTAGYDVNTEFGGHGVGSTMHQDPHISNAGRRGSGAELRPGMLLAIEPWVMADTAELVVDPDGWTLRSATGARTAHSEHTVAVTEQGPLVLTA